MFLKRIFVLVFLAWTLNFLSAEQLLDGKRLKFFQKITFPFFSIKDLLIIQKQLDYVNHECIRNCEKSKPMECIYDFKLEWYSVLSRNCFNCTENPEDCFKPHCVSANGFIRPIKTVNRILPGKSI